MRKHFKFMVKRHKKIIAIIIIGMLALLIAIGNGTHSPVRATVEWCLAKCDQHCYAESRPPKNYDCEASQHPQTCEDEIYNECLKGCPDRCGGETPPDSPTYSPTYSPT